MAKSTSTATIQLQCTNPHSIPTFEAFINEAVKRFEVEKNAKNNVYSFILSHGLLNEFCEFCEMTKSDNPHQDCLKSLGLLITNQN